MINFKTEQLTLKLRDAVRVLFWVNFNPELKQINPTKAHADFYSWWYKQRFASMNWCELQLFLQTSGVSIEQALVIRENYYYGLVG